MSSPSSFEPQIVGFLCNWCAYAAADRAGQSRTALPASFKVVNVPCSGRVEPELVLHAFELGADGVLVCGCHPGDCHYVSGNAKALGRILLLKQVMLELGIEADRLWIRWASATEGHQLAALVHSMSERLRLLGPFASSQRPPAAARSRRRARQ